MASHRKKTDEILVKVDHNNLMYIDPNTIISDGVIEQRKVQPEDLVMYVNLEADLIPRTTLIMGDEQSKMVSIAKGSLSFMKNASGQDYDTKWTDSFLEYTEKGGQADAFSQFDSTAQTFGIDTIDIKVAGTNFIPQVTIKFIDVRGKTLFESPENSPYKAFFHLPWPIFYLTVKGYYGKAIKYRIHLVSFSSKYNSTNGNFEITTTFVGSTYAYLCDIPLNGILNAPYMFPIEYDDKTTYNESTGYHDKVLKKTSKGYTTLKAVYHEYIQKGLLDKNFPVKTLREVLVISRTLNKILEQQIFTQVIDPKILAGIKEFEDVIVTLENQVREWGKKHLSGEIDPITKYYKLSGYEKNTTTNILGKEGTLQNYIIRANADSLNNAAFGVKRNESLLKKDSLKILPISFDPLVKMDLYVIQNNAVLVKFDEIINIILDIQRNFAEQTMKIEETIEKEMNTIVETQNIGIGFRPTIRNLVGIILANADTYIRLLKDVHYKAFQVADQRKSIIQNFSKDETIGESIYPWPEIKKPAAGTKQNVLVYPGSLDMIDKLQANNRTLWPEIDFVENFYGVSTKKIDPLTEKEGDYENINYVFETDASTANKKEISTLTFLSDVMPYTDESLSSIVYEIWERALYITSFDSFDSNTLKELALLEFSNLQYQINGSVDVVEILKQKVAGIADLKSIMYNYSPFERYPYYQDQYPTISYLKDALGQDFIVEKYIQSKATTDNKGLYPELAKNLENYSSEKYRKFLYPFSSSTYKDYLESKAYTQTELSLNKSLSVNTIDSFIQSSIAPTAWVSDTFKTNLFTNTLTIDGKDRHILNTPYFHRQLYSDFTNNKIVGKYASSAYLLLNSLPFKDLDDSVRFDDHRLETVLMSSLFREVSATHYIPYHLMLKWGAIYHRYKTYILDEIDIISGITEPINGELFFNANLGGEYLLSDGSFISRVTKTNIGLNPFYQSVFHQVVNDYIFYDQQCGPVPVYPTPTPSMTQTATLSLTPTSSVTPSITPSITVTPTPSGSHMITSSPTPSPTPSMVYCYEENYYNAAMAGVIRNNSIAPIGGEIWTSFIDNSKFDSLDSRYTLLPSNGNRQYIDVQDFFKTEQDNYSILWFKNTTKDLSPNYSGTTIFPTYDQYFKDLDNIYSLSANNKQVLDLIATFKPEILDVFESAFLEFASQTLNEEAPYIPYDVKYNSFQGLLKKIVSVEKTATDPTNIEDLVRLIQNKQELNLIDITNNILSNENLIKLTLGNPKEINNHILGGFTGIDVSNYYPGNFYEPQVADMLYYMELYLGKDIDGSYLQFFQMFDIELNEENIKNYRFLIYAYAGYITEHGLQSIANAGQETYFKQYIIDNVINKVYAKDSEVGGQSQRLELFINTLTGRFNKNLESKDESQRLKLFQGHSDEIIKLEMYNFFKSFNDKWVAGNSMGQKTLMEEFLYLDKANRDIGDVVFLDMERLVDIFEQKNKEKVDLYTLITILIKNSGFDIRALPAYVNFYGTKFSNKTTITPSKTVAKNIFGSFLEIDYQESSPKIILQYIGPTSKHLQLSDINRKYKFKDDSFDMSDTNNNPIIVSPEVFRTYDYSKSNKAVAFEVSFGDQNQSLFKGLELDQTSIKNTSESFIVQERLGNSETGSSTAQIDIGLFDIYRQSSYSCGIVAMGDVMIQPTMYFYLKNVPLFKGSYWITEVSHNIKSSGIETTFRGSRIPLQSLPNPNDSFLASYRALFDRMLKRAAIKVKEENLALGNPANFKTSITYSGRTYNINPGTKNFDMNTLVVRAGIKEYGMPYNGYDNEENILLVKDANGDEWLRAIVMEMGGKNYGIADDLNMVLLSKQTSSDSKQIFWSDIKNTSKDFEFYTTKFRLGPDFPADYDTILYKYPITNFLNPKNGKTATVTTSRDFVNKRFSGPVNNGPNIDGVGIGISEKLRNHLGASDGDVLYFELSQK